MKGILLLPLVLLLTLFTSCVSQQKFSDLENVKNRLERQLADAEAARQNCSNDNAALNADLAKNKQQIAQLQTDLERSKQQYSDLDRTNRDLLERYDRMLAQNRQLLETTSGENSQLAARLSEQQQEVAQREKQLLELQGQLATEKQQQVALQRALEVREARVAELESAIAEKEARLKSIREGVNQALRGFTEADLTVREQNGKVYVSLSQNLLFPSGSKTINAQGKRAIAQLASVLKDNEDINITVEGHTDTDGDAAFNWDLSVGRATSVVKELTQNGVAPTRVIASGRGQFFPVGSNATAAGKALNHRTEIILTPKLEVLYNLLGE